MKAFEIYNKLEKFARDLGDENFTVSLALCEGRYYISVSCHSSRKYEFDHKGLQRTAEIPEEDLQRDIDEILDSLLNKYKKCLVPRENKNRETIEDAIKRVKEVSDTSSG